MNNLKVAFFTEAGTKRGMGHLVRCYTIFEEFKQKNFDTYFYLDSDISYDYKYKDISYFFWDSLSMDKSFDIVFIDSYEASSSIYKEIYSKSKITIYIDDYERLSYPPGIIINFAPNSSKLFYKDRKEKNRYLLGLKYIPIRKGLVECNIKRDKQVFIMLGGSDTKNLSYEIIKTIEDVNIRKILVLNKESELSKFKEFKNLEVLYKPEDNVLFEAMKKSSFAISTASMTLYELAYLKVPTIIIAVSDDQKFGYKQLLKYKLASSFVDINSVEWKKDLYDKFNKLIQDNSSNYSSKIDGYGVSRIFNLINRWF